MPNLHTYLHTRVKGMQNRHLPPLLRFIPQFAQICIIFALSKYIKPAWKHINDLVMHNVVVVICHVPILGIWKQTEEIVLSWQGRELSKNVLSKFKRQRN